MSSSTPSPWRALLGLVRPAAWRYVGLSLAILAATAPVVVIPLIVSAVVDDVALARRLGGLLLVLAVASQLLKVASAWLATTLAWNTANDLRTRLAHHTLSLDHEFHRANTPGALISRIDGDVTSISDFLGLVVKVIGSSMIMMVGILGVLLVVDWRLGLGATIYVLAVGVVLAYLRNQAVPEAEASMSAKARLYGGIEERLTAGDDIRGNGAATHAIQRFIDNAHDHLIARLSQERAFLTMWTLLNVAVAGGLTLSVVVGGWLVSTGSITVGTAFLVFQYALWIRRPISDILHQMETVQRASGAINRINALIETRPDIADDGTISPSAGPLSVTFDQVGFNYADGQPVLSDVDLSIPAGRSVGVVGRTGSGKTTVSRLVLRLVEATSGRLSLGGVPIEDIPLSELRRRVALVPQDVQLVRGTVGDNVTLFDPTPSDGEIRQALAAVGLDLDPAQELGSGQLGLSAGESQLLALARVWLRQPDLIVLDEATARIDPGTESAIQAAITALLEGRTAIIIAHRLSTLDQVDHIVVFDHGRIVEQGEREALATRPGGHYNNLLELARRSSGVVTQ